jgi:hypothetical protein
LQDKEFAMFHTIKSFNEVLNCVVSPVATLSCLENTSHGFEPTDDRKVALLRFWLIMDETGHTPH